MRRPLGKLVYNLLSIQELKKRLKECHLSTQGSRDQLIKRHQNFVQIYNAECDSLNPKSGNAQACFFRNFPLMKSLTQLRSVCFLYVGRQHHKSNVVVFSLVRQLKILPKGWRPVRRSGIGCREKSNLYV